jgi:hypothetical protein
MEEVVAMRMAHRVLVALVLRSQQTAMQTLVESLASMALV